MIENFAELFESDIKSLPMELGSVVKAKIIRIEKGFVVVDAGFKSEGLIFIEEFHNEKGELDAQEGDEVDVVLVALDDGFGETRLSRKRARDMECWLRLENVHSKNETIRGVITGKVKGGFTVEIDTIKAFLPGSLVDIRPVRDSAYLEGKELDFKVIKMDLKRNNVVVSRRAVVEEENSSERAALLDNLTEGKVIHGVVKNLTDYGAFVDLGGIDGLLHITDMSWKRIKHPSEMINVGDEISVVILKFDKERNRVSLGIKQMGDDPWVDIQRRYPEGTRMFGKVTNITDYGCFVEIEDGVEGLVHVSEMSWTNKNIHPNKVVKLGDEVEVKVLEIDEERRRISLGIKQCQSNPWQIFAENHRENAIVKGAIKSITDFGIFIGLEGNIDGLIHINDISWSVPGEEAIRQYKKGDEIEAIILAIDADRERISLGIKQLSGDPFGDYVEKNAKGTIVTGKVIEADAKGARIFLGENVEGYIRASDISKEKVKDAREHLKTDETVEAKIVSVDRKNRIINLSIKAKDAQDDEQAVKSAKEQESQVKGATLGDLLKEQMDNRNGE